MRPLRLSIVAFAGVQGIILALPHPFASAAPPMPPAPNPAPASAAPAAPDVSPSNTEPPPVSVPPPLAEVLVGSAKLDYEAGRSFYATGDYAGARLKLQTAYNTSAEPRLLWDIAVCETGLKHYAKAVSLVRQYLDSNLRLITPEAAEKARLFLDAARKLTAHVDVESNPPHAFVYLDGEPIGEVPLATDFRVDLGVHRITVKKHNFGDYAETLTISEPVDVYLRAVLRAVLHQGRVVVRAGGADAVAVDGVAVGAGNWEGVLPSGPHAIVVTEPGWPPFDSQIVVGDNQTFTIDPSVVDVTTAASNRAKTTVEGGVPTWVWLVGGALLAVGIASVSYVFLKSPDPQAGPMPGSVAFVQLP